MKDGSFTPEQAARMDAELVALRDGARAFVGKLTKNAAEIALCHRVIDGLVEMVLEQCTIAEQAGKAAGLPWRMVKFCFAAMTSAMEECNSLPEFVESIQCGKAVPSGRI